MAQCAGVAPARDWSEFLSDIEAMSFTGILVVAPAVKKLALNATAIVGGVNVVGTVTLSAKAPVGGVPVVLSSSNTAAATVPAAVTVPAGATTAQFTVTTMAVGAPASAVISAVWGVTKTDSLTVKPPKLRR